MISKVRRTSLEPSPLREAFDAQTRGWVSPFDLTRLKTYSIESRTSKVFAEDLGRPVSPDATLGEWLDALPNQLAGKWIKRAATVLATAAEAKTTVVAAIGGHVIKTGCGPYLIRLMEEGVIGALAMNGATAIHDYELALAGRHPRMWAHVF